MRDVEADHVSYAEIVVVGEVQVGVLVHHFCDDPALGCGVRGSVAGPEVKCGNGQAGVKGGIAFAHGDDGLTGLRHGLNVGPDLQRGLET